MEQEFYLNEVKVGQKVENFKTQALMPNGEFEYVSLKENMDKGMWTILFFYPLDFTFICPTEITALSNKYKEIERLNAQVIGCSTDSVHSHLAWSKLSVEDGGIGKLNYPLAEDTNHSLSEQFGVLIEEEGIALRGLFIISPEGVLEHSTINSLNVGRNVDEVIRTLQALQTGGLCPVNWNEGEKTL